MAAPASPEAISPPVTSSATGEGTPSAAGERSGEAALPISAGAPQSVSRVAVPATVPEDKVPLGATPAEAVSTTPSPPKPPLDPTLLNYAVITVHHVAGSAGSSGIVRVLHAALASHNVRVLRYGVAPSDDAWAARVAARLFPLVARFSRGDGVGLAAARLMIDRTLRSTLRIDAPRRRFAAAFGGTTWDAALATGRVWTAEDAMANAGCGHEELLAAWDAAPARAVLAPGIEVRFCECLTEGGAWVLNGHFPAVEQRYYARGVATRWFFVSWHEADIAWDALRRAVIGVTGAASSDAAAALSTSLFSASTASADPPTTASAGSALGMPPPAATAAVAVTPTSGSVAGPVALTAAKVPVNGILRREWQRLGLDGPPSEATPIVTMSAGPLHAVVERAAWLATVSPSAAKEKGSERVGWDGAAAVPSFRPSALAANAIFDDPFVRVLSAVGVPSAAVHALLTDAPLAAPKQRLLSFGDLEPLPAPPGYDGADADAGGSSGDNYEALPPCEADAEAVYPFELTCGLGAEAAVGAVAPFVCRLPPMLHLSGLVKSE